MLLLHFERVIGCAVCKVTNKKVVNYIEDTIEVS